MFPPRYSPFVQTWAEVKERLARYPGGPIGPSRFRPDAPFTAGFETRARADDDRYFWEGTRRGGDPTRPFIVFQVTLEGSGIYESGGARNSVPPGRAFAAIVPSAHRYYLPPDVPAWTFFWTILRHPYIARRLVERQRSGASAVLEITPESPLLACTLALFEGAFPDAFAEELALFAFLTEYERHIFTATRTAPSDAGERLLEETRRFVRERLDAPTDVAQLAALHGMTRTRFSHRFREITGESPARFMARIRLEEAAHLLAQTDETLTAIAASTGFADANHLCKAFRRHFQVSPGTFRRQMR